MDITDASAVWRYLGGSEHPDGVAPGVSITAVPFPDVLVVTGDDRLALAHRMVTGDLENVAAGAGKTTALLTVKGRVTSWFSVLVGETSLRFLAPKDQGQVLADALGRFAIMDDFETASSDDSDSFAIVGPGVPDWVQSDLTARLSAVSPASAASLGAALEGSVPQTSDHPMGDVRAGGPMAVAFGADGVDVMVLAHQWGLPLFGFMEIVTLYRHLNRPSEGRGQGKAPGAVPWLTRCLLKPPRPSRVAAGQPVWGAEFTGPGLPDGFPQELGLEGLIDFGQGVLRLRD